MITSIADIQRLVIDGFTDWKQLGEVRTVEHGDLILFNYTEKAQYAGTWNYFETVSRGLILNRKTGEVVALPFSKFFNWGEGGRVGTGDIVSVTEKVDGSLGILYRYEGEYRIATRGSFDSEQAIWATNYLNTHYRIPGYIFPETLLFEIVYPGNRIVVDYGDREELVLLAIRNRFNGNYLPWSAVEFIAQTFGFGLPGVYQFNTPADILEAAKSLDANSEGWVVEMSDGTRWKFKGDRYKELHRLISGLSFKWVLECCANGTIDQALAAIPDEFLGQAREWIAEIEATVTRIKDEVEAAFWACPKSTRKEYAMSVMANYKPLAPYLFARMDRKELEPLIYKMAFNDR